ncbi:peptidoglycan-binding protein [Streptomyces sp. NPDC047968]|uniref:peptidoglycan-binding domain-containing protein n=1 Tax=unclassified Streptomyces TaxID=2593676 RepID=UPI00342B0172
MTASRRHLILVASVAVLGTACSPSAPPPPSADLPDGRVHVTGEGHPGDDWEDEGLLGENLPVRSDLAAMWQSVLWADGYLRRSDVDCHYAGRTVEATRVWQSNRGLAADGIVGPKTFGRAGRQLLARDGAIHYEGAEHTVRFRRDQDGRYSVLDGGTHKPLRRDRPTLSSCEEAAGS